MSFSYANPTSGPSAGGIGWFNFGTFTLIPSAAATTFSGTLNDGTKVSFDISLTPVSGTPRGFQAVTVPTFPGSNFGVSGYTGITGNVALNSILIPQIGVNTVNISNIVVLDANNVPVSNYTVVLADAERTNQGEIWTWNTNGGNWAILAELGNAVSPTLTGIGTQTANIIGINLVETNAYVLTTQSPTNLALTLTNGISSREAFSIGFATTRVRLQKNIAGRADAADQFRLDVTGTPSGTATTSGSSSGIQTQSVELYAVPGNSYVISEAMAPGSVSPLSAYTQIVSAANATPAGSVPPTGSLPITFTPVLGDDVTYTILNVAPEAFTKTVDKAYADIGEILTYSIAVENPNNFDVNNVLVTDPTPAGTTYVGNITSSVPYTGTTLPGGITLTTIPANTTATVSWQVQVNSVPPIPTPIPNVGSVSVPGGTSGTTNAVSTQVNTAYVTVNKVASPAFAKPGDIITYTIMLMNAGNVPANNVVLTDSVPAGTTFVPGSVVGASGTPPTLTLANPIPAGGSATVSFQVQVGASLPNPNPVPNSATVAYTYTVDPANPNGASGTRDSNTATTQVNAAIVSTVKSADLSYAAPGDIITYTLVLTNSGNTGANNVVLTDNLPAGTTFVAGSVTGASGTPPTLTLNAAIPAGDSATVTFKVQVGDTIPVPNPLVNSATAAFTYTVDPQAPNGAGGSSVSNPTSTQVNGAVVTTVKAVDKTYAEPGAVLTYTLTLTNSGNTPANSVVITDAIPAGTTFVAGSVTGAAGTPPTLTLPNPIPVGGAATVTFQVLVDNAIPLVNPIPNSAAAAFTFTTDPTQPNGRTGVSDSNAVTTQINRAMVTAVKTATPDFADVGDTVSYTITLTNTGNVAANNVVLTDVIPAGTSFVPGTLLGATGTPPSLTLANPIPAGGTATVTFDVLIGNSLPKPNPIENSVAAAFTYTVDPARPNQASGTAVGGPAATQVNTARLLVEKSADKPISYIGDIITYQISVKNTGNVSADNVVLTDLLPTGVSYVPGSLLVSVPYSGTLASGLALTGPIAAGQTVTLTFRAKVDAIPSPNPILNQMKATYAYTVDPAAPDAQTAAAASNVVSTIVFRYNFGQQISDLIESVALEQAALAALANAEGAKIQKLVATDSVTTQELLCLNRSVSDMLDSLAMLESVLKQKLGITDCQINGMGVCM